MRLSEAARPRRVIDGALVAGALAGAALIWIANRAPVDAPWSPSTAALSRDAVAADPLDPMALRNLGLALERAGDGAAADRLMSLAWDRTRRDTPTAAWILVRRLSEGRYDAAFGAADSLLRRNVDEASRERLFKLLLAAAHYDVSRPAVIRRLADAPWWRLAYIRELTSTSDSGDIDLVFAGLSRTHHPPTAPEFDADVTRLIEDKAYAAAARDWRAFSRPNHDPNDVGDLTAPAPFGWSPVFGEGASSAVEDGALRVDYDGYSSPHLPARLLALPPGRYALSWRRRSTGDPSGAVGVAIACAATSTALATTPGQQLDFEVPPSGCEGQSLAITPLPGDHRVSISVWFDRWTLSRR